MKIAILQQDIIWGDIHANCEAAAKAIDAHPGSNLYILPEMFSTGFATQPKGIADADGYTLNWMKQKAREKHAAICGSVAIEDHVRYYNRLYFVKPDGSVQYYDKHHLFTYGGEHYQFTAGKDRVIVNYEGYRILLAVCYDLRFPVWSRNNQDYDLAIYVASWPAKRQLAWDTLLRARAIENQCYLVGVNRVGDDPVLHYSGGSVILDPNGEILAACESEKEQVAVAEIDIKKLEEFRKKFPVLDDIDNFILK